jgi:hypothetical protein
MYALRRPFRFIHGPGRSAGFFPFLLFFFCALFLFFPSPVSSGDEAAAPPADAGEPGADPASEPLAEELRRQFEHEAAAELLSLQLGDSEVALQVSGYWKGTLSGNLGLSLSPLGTAAVSPDSPVLFRQEADMTLTLRLRKRWFLEASFLDDYNLNTYRAGYQGLPGETVQYAGFGNRGLDFPNFPYLDLGGDSPSSFGAYGRFGGGSLSLHALVRYDLAAMEERIFVGDRERTFSYTPLNQPIRGRFFVLPDENLDAPPVVYLEDEKGEFRDGNGRRWRLAAPSEYAAGREPGLVELGAAPSGAVAAAYTKGVGQPWNISLGDYNVPASRFLPQVQEWFGNTVDLRDYPQPGETSVLSDKPGDVYINGVWALVIYEPGTFSPFERMGRYAAASSASADAALVQLSTGDRVSGYEVLSLEENAVSADIPLYAVTETRRGIYELFSGADDEPGQVRRPDRRSVQSRWPLGDQYPQLYLPGAGVFTGDLGIRFTNYGSAGSYHIGTDVVPGSVQVWRGGLMDPRIAYDAAGGVVSLESPARFNETIRITYLKRSVERQAGSLAAGIGTVYNPEGPFSSEFALGMRWNLDGENTYAESGALNPGTVGLGAKAAWDYEHVKARITGGLGFEQPDTTGRYRAAGMEGHQISLALPAEDSFISEAPGLPPPLNGLTLNNRSDLTYRNYRDPGILGNLMPIDWGGAVLVSGKNGPYPVRDPALSSVTHTLAAEFTLDAVKTWAGFEVPLGNDGALMEQAREIEVPFRFYGFDPAPPSSSDFQLFIQIGALSDKDLGHVENPGLIVEKKLYEISSGNFSSNKSIIFPLTDEDRRKLRGAKYLRIFVVHTTPETIRGRVLLAPPIVRGLGFRPVLVQGSQVSGASDMGVNTVRAFERRDSADRLEDKYGEIISRLHHEGQSQGVLELEWEKMAPGVSAGADGRISAPPLSSYRRLVFFVKGPSSLGSFSSDATFRFILGRGPESLARNGEIYLDAEIPLSAFQSGQWSKVELNYRSGDRKITVEGKTIDSAPLVYRSRQRSGGGEAGTETDSSEYLAFFVNSTGSLPDGGFSIDEIFLEDPSPAWRLNGGGSVEWNHPGVLVSHKGGEVLSDLSLSTALESGIRGDPFTPEPEGTGGIISRSDGEFTLWGTRFAGQVSLNALDNQFYWDGGHRVSRSWGPVSVEESFSAAPEEKNMDHRFGLDLAGMVSSRLNGEVYYADEKLDRKWLWSFAFTHPRQYIPALSIETTAVWIENTRAPGEELHNYGEAWARSWIPMAPDLGAGAIKRDTRGLIRISEKTSPVGAELSLEGISAVSKINSRTLSSSLARLDIPVRLGSGALNFRVERGFRRQLVFAGKDAREDGMKFGESLEDSLPLWGAIPLYSLFSPDLGSAMDRGLAQSPSAGLGDYSAFNDHFSVSLRLPPFYDRRALYVPVSAGLNINRILEQKLDTRLDLLNLGGNLGFSAVNVFGAFGVFPLFSFYRGDEFSQALEMSVAIPREEEPSWRFQSRLGGSFQGFSGGELGFTNTLTAGSSGWLESLIVDWTVPTKKSLLSILYNWIAAGVQDKGSWPALADLVNTGYEQLRQESLELVFDHSGAYLSWSMIAGHESIIRIFGRLYLSVFAKLNCTQDEQAQVLSFIGTIGATLNMSF